MALWYQAINTLRPRQNGRRFADDTFKCIFLNENVWISIKISLNFVPKGPINNIPALVQIMAWRRPGDKPLSEPMMVSLPMHLCVTLPQWVNWANAHLLSTRLLGSNVWNLNQTTKIFFNKIHLEKFAKWLRFCADLATGYVKSDLFEAEKNGCYFAHNIF